MKNAVLIAVVVLGCSTRSVPAPEPTAAAHASAPEAKPAPAPALPPAAPQEPAPKEAPAAAQQPSPSQAAPIPMGSGADACAAIAARFDALRGAAKGACTSDADCACFSDVRFDNQMGVGDRATAAKLQALSDDYRKRHCPTICVQTAPAPACKPRCEAGTCR